MEKGQLRPDPSKVKAVENWSVPTTHKQLQSFLRFSNFFRRFIRNYSQVAAAVTQLTSVKKTFNRHLLLRLLSIN